MQLRPFTEIPRMPPPRMLGAPPTTLASAIALRVAAESGEIYDRHVYRDALGALETMAAENGKRHAAVREKMLRTADPTATRDLREESRQIELDAERVGETLQALRHLLDTVAPEHERQRRAALKAALSKRKALAPAVDAAKEMIAQAAAALREARELEAEIARFGGVPVSTWTGAALAIQGAADDMPPLALYDAAGRKLDLGPASLMVMPRTGEKVRIEALGDTIIPPSAMHQLPTRVARGDAFTATIGVDGAALIAGNSALRISRLED